MADSVLLLCKYDGRTVVVKVTESFSFKDLIDRLSSKLENMCDGKFVMEYSVPENPNCILADDSDLQNMFMLALSFNKKRIDVVVKRSSDVTKEGGSTSVAPNANEGGSTSVAPNANEGGSTSVAPYANEGGSTSVAPKTKEGGSTSVVPYTNKGDSTLVAPNTIDVIIEHAYQRDMSKDSCTQEEPISITDGWENGISVVGQAFKGGATHFRNALAKCAIKAGFQFTYVKNDKRRVTAICALRESTCCMWRVHATREVANGFFYIRTLNNTHMCGATVHTSANKRMSSNIVASCIIDDVQQNPLTRPVDIMNCFKLKYGLDITYNHAWLGVEKAKNDMFGDQSLSYDDLRWYVDSALKTNPGSRLELEYDSFTGHFKRLFVSFEACIYGFNYCRPLLFLDDTSLKGKYKGNLLAATAKDGDQELFPLAFAVVDSANKDNWHWFLQQLSHVVLPNREITFISNWDTGLLEAMPSVFPHCHHAFCLFHLEEDLRGKLTGSSNECKDAIIHKLQFAAYTPTAELFEKTINEMKAEGKDRVINFLSTLPPEHWSNAYFKGKRYGEMSFNAAESFNSWMGDARHLPILKMVDTIRSMLMEQMSTRKKGSLMINLDFCPKIDAKLLEALYVGRAWHIVEVTDQMYEVKSHPSVLVDIEARTCSCFQWQLNGFPCAHAAAAINHTGKKLNLYVEEYFFTEYYRQSYSKAIYPVPTSEKPNVKPAETIVLPPLTKRQPGWPKKKRIVSRDEKLRQIKCSRCGRYANHNRKTCKEVI